MHSVSHLPESVGIVVIIVGMIVTLVVGLTVIKAIHEYFKILYVHSGWSSITADIDCCITLLEVYLICTAVCPDEGTFEA